MILAVAVLACSAGAVFAFVFSRLRHARRRDDLLTLLRERSTLALYGLLLDRLLRMSDRLFGPAPSAHALGVCFALAYVCAVVSFMIGYVHDGSGVLFGVPVVSATVPTRWPLLPAIVLVLLVAVLVARRADGWDREAVRLLHARNRTLGHWGSTSVYRGAIGAATLIGVYSVVDGPGAGVGALAAGVFAALSGAAAIAAAGAGVLAILGVDTGLITGHGAVVFAVAVALALALGGSVPLSVAITFSAAVPIVLLAHSTAESATPIILVFAVLPVTTSLFDWYSLRITRYVLGRVAQEKRSGVIAAYAALDGLATFALFAGLAWLMPLALAAPAIASGWWGSPPPMPALEVAQAGGQSGGGELSTTLVMATVAVPTLAHACIWAFAALCPALARTGLFAGGSRRPVHRGAASAALAVSALAAISLSIVAALALLVGGLATSFARLAPDPLGILPS